MVEWNGLKIFMNLLLCLRPHKNNITTKTNNDTISTNEMITCVEFGESDSKKKKNNRKIEILHVYLSFCTDCVETLSTILCSGPQQVL